MIQKVNIELILRENLPEEITLLSKQIALLHEDLARLSARRTLLLNIAEVAGVDIKIHAGPSDAGRNSDGSFSNGDLITGSAVLFD